MTITTVIITKNSNNDKIAMAFTGATYSDLKAQSAELASTLVDRLIGKTDKVNGKVVTAEDAAQAVSEEVASLSKEDNDGGVFWATSKGNGIIEHNKTGVQYFQGACVKTIVLEQGDEPKAKKARGSRNGVTLAKKVLRKLLPTAQWKMAKLVDGSERFDGAAAVDMWATLQG